MEANIGGNQKNAMRSLSEPDPESLGRGEAGFDPTLHAEAEMVLADPTADIFSKILEDPGADAPAAEPILHTPAKPEKATGRSRLRLAPRPFPYNELVIGDRRRAEAVSDTPLWRFDHAAANRISDIVAVLSGPVAAGLVTGSIAVFLAAAMLVMVAKSRARRLALSEMAIIGIAPVAAALGAFVVLAGSGQNELRSALLGAGAALLAGGISAGLLRLGANRMVRTRIVVIGSATNAHELAWELQADRNRRYEVVGYVTRNGAAKENLADLKHVSFGVRRLGTLADLEDVVDRHRVDMLVMSEGTERLEVFERAARCAEHNDTRLVSLNAFNELVFQRVAVEELNSAWLQHIMHPRYRPAPRVLIRALDIAGAVVIGVLTMPIWLITALLVKLEDGGPVFYSQERCGERGRVFTIVKFRSMRPDAEAHGARWSAGKDDDRITRVGAVIRRLHIDELPQLLNVLHGDMSIVGPRPERPEFVYGLEREIPFYNRRHLVKPGITGWAQVRAGYGMSDEGAMIKLSRDLFYLKHQSLFLYVYILLATVWTVVTGSVHDKAR